MTLCGWPFATRALSTKPISDASSRIAPMPAKSEMVCCCGVSVGIMLPPA